MPGNPFTDPNWAAELADTVERVVGSVRDKTTRPIVKASRAIVFGLIAAMVGVVVVTLAVIGAMRAVEALLDLWSDATRERCTSATSSSAESSASPERC